MSTKFNIVKFAGCVIELESPWKMTTGLKPDVNRATINSVEYAKLPPLGTSDKVEFFFNASSSADLTVQKITLYDAQPIQYGSTAQALGAFKVIKYRLMFIDQRFAFVDPRGGRLVGGVINPSTINPPDPDRTHIPAVQKMDDLISACLNGMGIAAAKPSTSILAPNDLKWFGTHAPTELEKLLGMSDMVFALQPDGTYQIFNRNDGSDPTIAVTSKLPVCTLDGADARAKTVVFASYPTQITNTLVETDLNSGDLKHVYRNSAGAWQLIDNCGVFGGGTAITEMNNHFPGTPDPRDQSGCYRYMRLNPDRFDPINSPILRKTYPAASSGDSDDPDGLPPLIEIQFKAMVAVQDPATKLWKMPGAKVAIPIDRIHDGNVLGVSSRLVKLKSGTTSTSDLEGNCDPIDLDNDITIRFSVGSAPWDASQQEFIPDYFYTGFNGTASSPAQISSDQCKAALTDPQTITIPVHELVAMRFGPTADPTNLAKLQSKMQPLAARFLLDTTRPPRVLSGVGFIPWTFNGRIAEVEIDQQAIVTRFKVDTWFRPACSYLAQEFGRLRKGKESHPHEAQTAGKRTASGAAGSAAPVQPMTQYFPPASPNNSVTVTVGTGTGNGRYAGSILTGAATAITVSGGVASLTGVGGGTDCLILNGPEHANTGSVYYLASGAIVMGFVVGTDASTHKPIVLISAMQGTPCT